MSCISMRLRKPGSIVAARRLFFRLAQLLGEVGTDGHFRVEGLTEISVAGLTNIPESQDRLTFQSHGMYSIILLLSFGKIEMMMMIF